MTARILAARNELVKLAKNNCASGFILPPTTETVIGGWVTEILFQASHSHTLAAEDIAILKPVVDALAPLDANEKGGLDAYAVVRALKNLDILFEAPEPPKPAKNPNPFAMLKL